MIFIGINITFFLSIFWVWEKYLVGTLIIMIFMESEM